MAGEIRVSPDGAAGLIVQQPTTAGVSAPLLRRLPTPAPAPLQALAQQPYLADFTARPIEPTRILRLSRQSFDIVSQTRSRLSSS